MRIRTEPCRAHSEQCAQNAERKKDKEDVNAPGGVAKAVHPTHIGRHVTGLDEQHTNVDQDERLLGKDHERTIFGMTKRLHGKIAPRPHEPVQHLRRSEVPIPLPPQGCRTQSIAASEVRHGSCTRRVRVQAAVLRANLRHISIGSHQNVFLPVSVEEKGSPAQGCGDAFPDGVAADPEQHGIHKRDGDRPDDDEHVGAILRPDVLLRITANRQIIAQVAPCDAVTLIVFPELDDIAKERLEDAGRDIRDQNKGRQ
eukprot:1304482-Prymnesium_polylepis.1